MDILLTMSKLQYILLILVATFYLLAREVNSCNEASCVSVVSKCLLEKSCDCKYKSNSTCWRECFHCLGYQFNECCSCLDMCPITHDEKPEPERNCNVGDYKKGIPSLFNAITEMPDPLELWHARTFPIEIEYKQDNPKKKIKVKIQNVEKEAAPVEDLVLNCTVVFWAKCMHWKKCHRNCQSMGASSYRWFHNGCCECIGQYCISYGLKESSCSKCVQESRFYLEQESVDHLEYGEGNDIGNKKKTPRTLKAR